MRSPRSNLRFLAALSLVCGTALATARADAPQRVGVNAAVNTDANGTPPGGLARKLVIGEGVVHNERITTDTNGQTQILFIDGSSLSVGPNSDMTIDNFVYDPSTGAGQMTLTQLQGAMRFVGGKLSKQDNAVTMHMGTATIGVRGGVFLANVGPGCKNGSAGCNVELIFVYGKAVTVTSNGQTTQLFRPGFAVDIGASGAIGSPHPAPPGTAATILTQLDGRKGGNGGATSVPTNSTVANSPIPNTVSNNIQVSIQQANQNNVAIAVAPTPPTTTPPQVPTNQVQTTSSQTQPVVASPAASTPPPVAPAVFVGGVRDAASVNTGFRNANTAALGFTGNITYPANSSGQNGTLNGTATVNGNSVGFTLAPLTAGQTTNATATAFLSGAASNDTASGPATLTSDGDFFFANTVAQGGDKVFLFGGTPVSSSFYTATSPTPQVLAFAIQPDYALANGSQVQTIPFLPSFAGGTLPNAVVSPLYVVTQPNSGFGSFNASTNTGTAPFALQASLAINGSGSNQQAALVVSTGSFETSNTFGSVVFSGPVRGTYMPGGTSPLTQMTSAVTTVPASDGTSLFGGTSIDGFVLDQNKSDSSGNFSQQDAQVFQPGVASSTTPFGFNQPVLASTLPSGVGATRTLSTETGYFGGIMKNGSGLNYALLGAVGLGVNQRSSTLGAIFGGSDPFTPSSSGIGSVALEFGTLSGRNFARSAYIDDNIFGATENYTTPVVITTPGGATITYPTGASGATTFPTAAMVTSATVPGAANGLFQAAGATPCTCTYLQWGYWQANIPASNQGGPSNTAQSSYINTWVAGMPTTNLPTVGTGTYSGAAIGTVNNNGASYLAAGGFTNTYNFGNNSGSVSITNFDNHTFTGTVSGGGGTYAAAISGNGANGTLAGSFYGPGAAETGGLFAVHQTNGPSYIASGVFAGKLTGPIH